MSRCATPSTPFDASSRITCAGSPPHGRVASLIAEQDYGFIEASDGSEVYFHRNSVVGGGFDKLAVGDEVRFSFHAEEGEKGPQASTVVAVGKHHVSPAR
jgi:cold shock CspA family protein